jgi:hypothetical protein
MDGELNQRRFQIRFHFFWIQPLEINHAKIRDERKYRCECPLVHSRLPITESKSSVVSSSLFETVMTKRFRLYGRAKTGRYQMRYQILDLEIDGGELLDDCREHFVDAKFDFQV